MRREQRPTKKDFKYIISIFQVNDEEIYVKYKWNKASSNVIMTLKDAKKDGFKQQVDDFLKYNEIIKKKEIKSKIYLKRLRDVPKYFCTIENCFKKFDSSAGRDKHVNTHQKKIKMMIKKTAEDDKKTIEDYKKIDDKKKIDEDKN
ncbi:hypothetical protein RclHR1_00080010 [Rhizophagus clarus]|uniref:C2H2-type domain-containing protein n=1 Tax=Rhizophagus clarus TaxID=94130 RepID=A0A2Z6S5W0_9GLOM|nr:hypothetical protein RclHR1_00080010 [Rhizophagus clarus]GET04066.1 hypothetical protein GLOIN_2v1475059 [Rhizophagus clarus]